MARPLRIEFPGAMYHVTSRGNARQVIFIDDRDRARFLDVFQAVITRLRWSCHAYCLMGNHYHLVIETPEGGLSRGMRHLNGEYAQLFNRRHDRVGHVLQGRFKAILVDREAYLLEVCRYVVLNPVRAGMVSHVADWPWSSYRATAGLERTPAWLSTAWVDAEWGRDPQASRRRYAAFVAEGVGGRSPLRDARGGLLLGSDGFVERVRPALLERPPQPAVPLAERLAYRPALDVILAPWREGSAPRERVVRTAHLGYGYSLAEIGRQVGLHKATLSRIVRATIET